MATRPRGSGSKREIRPGVWELRVNLAPDVLTGRQRQRSSTFHGNGTAAEAALRKLVSSTDGERTTGSGVTFRQLLDDWLERKAHDCSPTTIEKYRELVDRYWLPDLGDVPLEKLRAKHLQAVIDRERRRGLSAPSVVRIHAVARAALKQAVRMEWLDRSPADHVVLPTDNRPSKPDPSVDELLAILQVADTADPGLGLIFRVAAATGCRRSELCGLRWRDVDLEHGRLVVTTGVVLVSNRRRSDRGKPRRARKVVVKDTKTHARRTITVDADTVRLLALLRAWMEQSARHAGSKLAKDAFVFSGEANGSKPLRPDWLTRSFKKAADEAGVEAHLHQLRHLSAAHLLSAGIPLRIVSKRVGHAKQSTTTDFYNDVIEAGGDAPAALVLGALLEGIGSGQLPKLEAG